MPVGKSCSGNKIECESNVRYTSVTPKDVSSGSDPCPKVSSLKFGNLRSRPAPSPINHHARSRHLSFLLSLSHRSLDSKHISSKHPFFACTPLTDNASQDCLQSSGGKRPRPGNHICNQGPQEEAGCQEGCSSRWSQSQKEQKGDLEFLHFQRYLYPPHPPTASDCPSFSMANGAGR
jgi:hypothetical protein